MSDLIAADALKLYFVRLAQKQTAIGIFYATWNSLGSLLPPVVDVSDCEAIELDCLGGIVFSGAPVLHVPSDRHSFTALAYSEHSCVLTGFFPQILADDGSGECADYAVFEPVRRAPDYRALAAAMSNGELLEDWSQTLSMFDAGQSAWKMAVREELERRGVPYAPIE
ncbi:hypothetical protein DW352_18400 [Pseudolabrys taiwanensis]|uniref:Uncharacterized protein n=1 Tax=Pseudolabrys taiwanensis TaxID=331696 RepID=A0A345ZZG9_9HYPH|nr:hypothetical protein [Pseudolabrys taiwanensis]AXK82316.1 hypothetical protein DW352_18400 [Pseudolabrys taiwanensis]